jgi:thiol-disulfide isomerase/thioredoxin
MKISNAVRKYRRSMTIVLAVIAVALMVYYDYCDTACSYLKGDVLGIDLKWVGVAYMALIIVFAGVRQASLVRIFLAAGLGVEVHLYAFQLQNDVYCPFCLAFSVLLIASFVVNYEVPSAWRGDRRRMWLYFLGEVNFPMFKINKLPLLLISVLAYLLILVTFNGSVTPAYGQEPIKGIPALSKGPYEIIIFADYFCPPCRRIDTKAEPLFKEILATGQVQLAFIDVPFTSAAPVYAKYYLYAVNADPGVNNVFHVRRVLFDAAQDKRIQKENALIDYLKEQNIKWLAMDEKSVFPLLSASIKEHKVDTTPTCFIKYSKDNVKKYVGDDKIWEGLTQFKDHLLTQKK